MLKNVLTAQRKALDMADIYVFTPIASEALFLFQSFCMIVDLIYAKTLHV